MYDSIIVGAGISGLSAASFLKMAGKSVLVLERGAQVAGTMSTIREEGFLADFGPNTILHTTPKIDDLVAYAGMGSHFLHASPVSKNRFVYKDGHIHALPMGPLAFLTTPLFSARAKGRLLKEPFIKGSVPGESIRDFAIRRLGQEFFDYAIDPFVSGVNAGDPARLSVQYAFKKIYKLEEQYGGLIRGAIKGAPERKARQKLTGERAKTRSTILNFKNGISSFPLALARRLGEGLVLGAEVTGIKGKPGVWAVTYNCGKSECVTVEARSLIFSVPAQELAHLMALAAGKDYSTLAQMPYAPVVQVFLGYEEHQVGHPLNGFGLLIPQKEQRHSLGMLFSSSLFPGRAPEGHVSLTCFLGGMQHQDLVNKSDDVIYKLCQEDLGYILDARGGPVFARMRRWQKAIPQYELDYEKYLRPMEAFERENAGCYISSNVMGGISVGDCIIQSWNTAQKIIESGTAGLS